MKKLSILLVIVILLVGCGKTKDELGNNGDNIIPNRFGIIETHIENIDNTWYLVYDKNTGVEYMIIRQHYSLGITPLYNSDGSLILYEEVL